MKKNNFILFLIVIAFLALTSCSQRGTIVLNNLKNDTLIIVPIKWITSDPTNVILNIKGYADDTCKINDYIFLPKGKINMTIDKDWYNSKEFSFYYKKYKSKNTSLKIDYYFPGF